MSVRGLPLAVLLGLCAAARAASPAPPKAAVLPGQDVELKTDDGWTIKGKYSQKGTAELTVILLHGKGERKELWMRMARALDKEGYGYLALDLRGHGESNVGPDGQPASYKKFKALAKGQNDFEDMARDIASGVAYLASQGVPEETIALIGTDVGGSVALKYAAVHPKIHMIVLLSPGLHYEEVLTPNAIRFYKNRPILMIYSDADHYSSRDTPILFSFAKMAAGEKNAVQISVPKLAGIRLPQSPAVIKQILSWLANPVAPAAVVSTATVEGQSVSSGSVDDALSPSPDEAPVEEPAPMRPTPQDQ